MHKTVNISINNQRGKLLQTLLLLGAVLLLWSTPALAQNDLLQLPAVKSPRAVGSLLLDVTRAGERLVAVGERGHILLSDDNGQSWRQGSVPVSVTLTAVQFPTAELGWVVGHDGVVLHSVDGGENWSLNFDGDQANRLVLSHYEKLVAAKETELAQAEGEAAEALSLQLEDMSYGLDDARYGVEDGPWKPFLDLWFSDASSGYIVGAYGLMFRTVDGGASWQFWGDRLDNLEGLHLNAISACGAGLFVAGEMGTIYRSTDGGQQWESLESPYEGSFFAVIGSETGDLVVAMGLRGNAIRSADGGASWQRLTSPLPAALLGATFLRDGRLVIASATLLNAGAAAQELTASKVKPSLYTSVIEAADGQLVLAGIKGITRVESIDLAGEAK
jgi:photosystem II stability/assembly factor-like uncharacterized protein